MHRRFETIVVEHVGLRGGLGDFAGSHVRIIIQLVVSCGSHLIATDLFRRIFPEGLLDGLGLLQTLDAFEGDGLDIIFIITIFLIHLIDHGIPESLTLCLIVSRSLASHRGNDCIISGMGADEAAVALLETEEVSAFSALLKAQDLLADVLEAGQNLDGKRRP